MKNGKAFWIVFLVLFLAVGIATVMAAEVCYFSDGVSVRWKGREVTWSNDSDKRQNAFHKITFEDGSTMGPRNISVPPGEKTESFIKVITNVEQCW